MVACATGVSVAAIQLLVSQSVIGTSSGFMQQNSCATVGQLKQRLQLVIENGDESGAIEVISSLENLTLSKEVLETTRIGLTVNDVRRQTAERWPDVSRRCRALIKGWQKLADFQRPQSSCGDSTSNSNGGTPSLISPASRRGLTPRTPGGGKRVTSTDYKCLVKNSVSPCNNGSYAPRDGEKSIVHKSASVGAALCTAASSSVPSATASTRTSRNGSQRVSPDMLPAGVDAASLNLKRKAQGALEGETLTKISKTTKGRNDQLVGNNIGSLNTGSNGLTVSTAGGGVSVARKNVQSTAELVAQLTGNLPQNMAISLQTQKPDQQRQVSQKLHEKKINSAVVSENGQGIRVVFSTASQEDVSSNSISTLGKVKRKYTKRAPKFFRNASADNLESIGEDADSNHFDDKLNGNVAKLETITEKVPVTENEDDSTTNTATEDSPPFSEVFRARRETNHWASLIPSINEFEEYKRRKSQEKQRPLCPKEFTKRHVLEINGKKFVALPYCDDGKLGSMKFNYKDKERFIAKDSLIHPLYSLSRSGNGAWTMDRSEFGLF